MFFTSPPEAGKENDNFPVAEYYISTAKFKKLVEKLLLNKARIIAPVETQGKLFFEEISFANLDQIRLSGFRTIGSFKDYFFKLTEKVSGYFGKDVEPQEQAMILMGARGCDTEALEVLDKVFAEGDFEDPFYKANRAKVIIISADCTDCGETCFCTTVKGQPYPTKNFDLNFSFVDGGYLVVTGSDQGKRLIEDNAGLFEAEVEQCLLAEKESIRQRVSNILADLNAKYHLKNELSQIHKRNIVNKVWRRVPKKCVECSACNFICPTCSCFLLLDQEKNKASERYKVWDACLKAGYARVAGGANPRGKLHERLQNRYHCKFDYSVDRLGRYACVGCGRCIDGCAGSIDMRKIFLELDKQL
ncbi:MAG: 4Fe-4S dicluster domain-containing protein [bacterium]